MNTRIARKVLNGRGRRYRYTQLSAAIGRLSQHRRRRKLEACRAVGVDELSPATAISSTWGHSGPGWYWWFTEYPDEGANWVETDHG